MSDSNEIPNASLIDKVIDGGYCIGCGACAAHGDTHEIYENEYGLYQARRSGANEAFSQDEVCPFSSSLDETRIGKNLYEEGSLFDTRVGYYRHIYAGYVEEEGFRAKGSSGGLATWLLCELFSAGKIQGVLHVGASNTVGELFGYRVSKSIDEIKKNSQTRYYPVSFAQIVSEVRKSEKTYAFVGVPCFVKAMRLLMAADPVLKDRVKYCIAIFCGHFKTKGFAEMIGWQVGVPPTKLEEVEFRVKLQDRPASQYAVQARAKDSCVNIGPTPVRELYGMDWGLGYFKPKSCDWCDDIAGETADLACGDAWLPEYSSNPKGTNIVITRNSEVDQLIADGISSGRLQMTPQSIEQVYKSQAGNYRHRHEGLSVRIGELKKAGIWHPHKRISEETFSVLPRRRKIYIARSLISEASHENFLKAKNRKSFLVFVFRMLPLEIHYYFLSKRIIKGVGKIVYSCFRLLKNGII